MGDCCYALWNALHIMAEINNLQHRTLGKTEITPAPRSNVPPDTELDLEVIVKELKDNLHGQKGSLGRATGTFYHNGEKVIEIKTKYWAISTKNS